jgi:hypothetical protein
MSTHWGGSFDYVFTCLFYESYNVDPSCKDHVFSSNGIVTLMHQFWKRGIQFALKQINLN